MHFGWQEPLCLSLCTPAFQRQLCYRFPSTPRSSQPFLPPVLCQLQLSRLCALKKPFPYSSVALQPPLPPQPPCAELELPRLWLLTSHSYLPTDPLHRSFGSWDIRDSTPAISPHLLSQVPSDLWNLFIQMAPSDFNCCCWPRQWHSEPGLCLWSLPHILGFLLLPEPFLLGVT